MTDTVKRLGSLTEGFFYLHFRPSSFSLFKNVN